jgi:carbamoylphosphate synthase large subunit
MRPILLVLASGDAGYREYVLHHLSTRYQLILLSPYPPTWERPYIIDHAKIDPADADDVIMTAVKVAGRTPVAGAVTYHEPCVELVAVIAEKLGLPHCDSRAAALCRDKFAAREAFRRAGVPSARYRLAGDADEASRAAAEVGYPLVVKPRALSASFGVSLVAEPAELKAAFGCAESKTLPEPWAHRRGVLLEEYLDGPEISVDSAVWQGRVEPVVYAKKLLGFEPFFEEEGHIVGPPDSIVPDPEAVRSVVVAAHQALGIGNGVTHTELRMTAAGPRVVEVNGRSGGDMIPYLAHLAAGIDLPLAMGDIAVGAKPDLSAAWTGVAGVRFFYPPSPGRLVWAGVQAPGGVQPLWLHQVTWLAGPGTEFRNVPGSLYFARAGFAIVTADTVEQCGARLATVNDQVKLGLEPL